MVRDPPVSGDPVGAAKRARCERAGALRLLGDGSSAAGEKRLQADKKFGLDPPRGESRTQEGQITAKL